MTALLALVLALNTGTAAAASVKPQCSADTIARILSPASKSDDTVSIDCSVKLPANSVVTRQIVFEGSAATGVSLDCNGSTLDRSARKGKAARAIMIRSVRKPGGTWDVPTDIDIRNCSLNGLMRIQGLSNDTDNDAMYSGSRRKDYTSVAQAAAPKRIRLENLRWSAKGIALYVAPGVSYVSLKHSEIVGGAKSVAIYLDAETAHNTVSDNRIDFISGRREVIAVDGSAHNSITGNTIVNPVLGGIFLYRNCGERGIIRHQEPKHNLISGNTFTYASGGQTNAKPSIWLNSRMGKRGYCFIDPNYPFGSSLSSLDYAQDNTVVRNRIVNGPENPIADSMGGNSIADNVTGPVQ